MPATKLTPMMAANAAGAVYGVQNEADIELAFARTNLSDSFELGETGRNVRFKAVAGAFGDKSSKGFGICAMGKDQYEGHALIVCRGTSTGQDVMTDANSGIQTTATGSRVHAGFNRTFDSMRGDIQGFIRQHNPRMVHCVGHSLGGALANLTADHVIHRTNAQEAALYTFGSPRVGMAGFAENLCTSGVLGKNNIFRVFHAGDPVAMVPLWPFVHAPQPDGEYYISKALHLNPLQHRMAEYKASLENYNNWTQFQKNTATSISMIKAGPQAHTQGQYRVLSLASLRWISHLMQTLLKEVLSIPMTVIGGVAIAGATMLDQLSYLLDKASKASTDGHSQVTSLLINIMKLIGITVKGAITLTLRFIRFVISSLLGAIMYPVKMALSLAS